MNRRQTLFAALGWLASGLWRPALSIEPSGADDAPDGPLCTPAESARIAARLERSSNAQNWPEHWRLFHYAAAVTWSADMAIAYGMGNRSEAATDMARARLAIDELGRTALAEHLTGDGCSWAIAVEGACDDALCEAMRGVSPEWWGCWERNHYGLINDQRSLERLLEARQKAGLRID